MSEIRQLSALVASDFPDEWYEIVDEGHFWLAWRFRAFAAQLRHLGLPLDAAWRGLDIGCGHGVVRSQLEAASRWTTDGADLNREALALQRAQRGEALYYDIRDRADELRERYDFVVLFDVLEHLAAPRDFLQTASYHLKPGGWVFVNVPALDRLRSAFDRAVGHLRRYDRRSIREEAEAAGLEVRDVRYWGMSMLPYLLVRKLMPGDESSVRGLIERGVQPPSGAAERAIGTIMRIETRLCARPPLGTSVLLAAVRPDAR